ncbi:MAG: DUF1848 domain-containing protein [Lachnospiraceae bacterium]|nr:DUF1848 domain-containing protein [Lachnospiraceae bacterium]
MIISASRKTDIPTFYPEWFMNRIKEGFVYSRNPMNAHQISKIPLNPEVTDCIVFWTKNPAPMLPYLDELQEYNYYFQVSLTGYGKDIEANLPDKKEVLIPTFQKLSDRIGPERVIWRYDPIALNERYTAEYHLRAFSDIAKALKDRTEKCVISFVDFYQKIRKNMDELHVEDVSGDTMTELAKRMYEIARENHMVLATCAEKIDLAAIGIEHNACIDRAVIERICGAKIKVKKDPSQRPECHCVESRDIGTYNTCAHGCRYCYANYSPEAVKKSMAKYDPKSPILCDSVDEAAGDVIHEVNAKSLLDRQLSLF